ncbi:MAG TPA: hypothetical protein VKX17_17330 [Planctomycetota bacterium]|nr:hypothetical protein [Planctomycetota bacterium]
MKRNIVFGVIGVIVLLFLGIKVGAIPNPLNKAPSFSKFNSVTVKGVSKAPDGQALVADGNAGSKWGNVEGIYVASNVAGSPVTNGLVLTANNGEANWQSLPTTAAPNGAAGGDLTGTYPNPTIAAGAVTATKIATGVIPTTLPPNGAAGGDLTGTYPNPTIAAGAVTQLKLATGVTAIPSGAAGGELSGMYPNPTIAKLAKVRIDGNFVSESPAASSTTTLNLSLGLTAYNDPTSNGDFIYSASANQLVCPKSGVYRIFTTISCTAFNASVDMIIVKNSNIQIGRNTTVNAGAGTFFASCYTEALLNKGDTIIFQTSSNAGTFGNATFTMSYVP